MDPWGIPVVTSAHLETCAFKATFYLLKNQSNVPADFQKFHFALIGK